MTVPRTLSRFSYPKALVQITVSATGIMVTNLIFLRIVLSKDGNDSLVRHEYNSLNLSGLKLNVIMASLSLMRPFSSISDGMINSSVIFLS